MKHLKIAFGLVMVAGLMSMAAAPAMGAPVWKWCREGHGGGTKYEDSLCTKEKTTGQFEWQEITKAIAAKSAFTVQLRDTKVPIAGTVEIQCKGTDKGKVGPGNKDEIEVITIEESSCKNFKNCEKIEEVKAVHTPWTTELAEKNGQQRDKIITGTGGEPGWAVKCRVLGVTSTDECLSTTGSTAMEDLANGTVKAIFEAPGGESGKAKCSVGGAEAGEVEGTDFNEAETAGVAISVS